jgi:predicted DNA-binding transcriptional regulator AlpA
VTAVDLFPLDLPRLITTSVIARALQVTNPTVRDMADRGLLPRPIRTGRRWIKFPTDDVRKAVADLLGKEDNTDAS